MRQLLKKPILSLLAVSLALAVPGWATVASSQYGYDSAGRLASVQTGAGATTTYGYDSQDRLVQEFWPGVAGGSGQMLYGYTASGGLGSVQDPRSLSTTYVRNGFGEVTQQSSPDTGAQTFTYDEAGNLKTRTFATGVTQTFQYDALNRLSRADSGDATTQWQYDTAVHGVGRLAGMQDNSGWSGWDYNALGGITSRTQVTTGGASLGVRYTYAVGQLTQMTYPSGRVVTFSYDAEHVASIAVNGVTVISGIQYQPMGPPVSWQMGSVGQYSRTFDTSGRITAHTHEGGQRTLEWDAANRLSSVQNPDGSTWSYGYDNLDRLVSATEGSQGTRSFTLDLNGNRSATTVDAATYSYSVDSSSNRLASATAPGSAQSFQYDAAGHILSDGTRVFTWTNAGQLASASSGASTTTYTYNGFGQRVKKSTAAGSRYYVYADDGTSLLGEYWQGAAGTPVGTLNETVYLEGIPVLVMKGSAVYFVQSDHLNTPRALKNAAGTVVWRWTSDAYGNGAPDQNPGGVMLFEYNARLPGQQFDAETGLYYNNARYYDPGTGRYISSDPIGLAGGINTYGYVRGNPVGLVDPYGLAPDLNYFSPNDPLRSWAQAIPNNPDAFVIAGHGAAYYIEDRTDVSVIRPHALLAIDLARNILASSSYVRGKRVILYSCNTGAAPDGLAQQLADILRVPVSAPEYYAYFFPPMKDGTAIRPIPAFKRWGHLAAFHLFSPGYQTFFPGLGP